MLQRKRAHRADVHGGAAARPFNNGVQTFGGAEQSLGLLDVVLLLGLQGGLYVLLLPALQEFQLLHGWTPKGDICVHKYTSRAPAALSFSAQHPQK